VLLLFCLSGEGEDGEDGEEEAGQVLAGEIERISFSNAIVGPVCRILAKRPDERLLCGGLKAHKQMPQHTIFLPSCVASGLSTLRLGIKRIVDAPDSCAERLGDARAAALCAAATTPLIPLI
jgi:hypothetical protein